MWSTRSALAAATALLALTAAATGAHAAGDGDGRAGGDSGSDNDRCNVTVVGDNNSHNNLACGDVLIGSGHTTGTGHTITRRPVGDPNTTLTNNTNMTLYAITAFYGSGPATLAPHTTYTLGDGRTYNAYGTSPTATDYWVVDIHRNDPEDGDNTTNCLGPTGSPSFGCTTDTGGSSGIYGLTLG